MGSVFKFKQFNVDQSGCAMKINTDGVLLGAIAAHQQPKSILDIGTGTGVIALMLAQSYTDAVIDAIEIDESAALAAAKNFDSSSFSDRLCAHGTSLEAYITTNHYNLIVSNPPFFVNDLKNPEGRKSIARHADWKFFESIIAKSEELLSDDGLLWLIVPVKQADFIIERSTSYNLFLQHEISIRSDINKPVIRKIICMGRVQVKLLQEDFYIYEDIGKHTAAYKLLLKDFFLAF
ncbi:tRNA1Val (adenine37-N6)-methyltransferase [Pedobacter sp. UYP24]